MPDKTANWGVPGSGARYRTQDSDPSGGGNFVVAERLDSNGDPVDVLLEWEETAGEWRYGGPVNFDGSDVTNVGALDADSVSTKELGNGPIVFSSEYDTIQAALDATGGGHLIIDDTKTEEAVYFRDANDGATVEWVGDNWIEQPANYTVGQSVIDMEPTDGLVVRDVTLIRPRIRNPNLGDADIENEATLDGPDTSGAIELASPNSRNAGAGPYPVNWQVIDPQIHHVNGYGVRFFNFREAARVRGGNIRRTAYDSVYTAPNEEGTSVYVEDIQSGWSGRHNVAISGNADEDHVTVSGSCKDAYTAGVDLEPATNVHLDVTVRNPSRSGGTANVDAGVAAANGTENVGGFAHIIDPNSYGVKFGSIESNGLEVKVEQSATQNPANVPEVDIGPNTNGNITVNVEGGGSETAAVLARENLADGTQPGQLNLEANVRNAYAASVNMNRVRFMSAEIESSDPVQGGTANVTESTHLYLSGLSGEQSRDNDVNIVAADDDGNAEYVVSSDGNTNYYRISGIAHTAYTTAATNNLGADSDATDLIT